MNPSNNHSDAAPRPAAGTAPAEVRDFLEGMKSKDPDQILAGAATFSLSTAMAQATVITIITLAAFTVGPLVYGKMRSGESDKPLIVSPGELDAAIGKEEPAKTPATPAPSTAKTPSTAKATAPPTGKEFLEKIGATDTKTASPKVNPLDKSADDLFNDIDK